MPKNVPYNVLFTHDTPVLCKSIRGFFLLENTATEPHKMALPLKVLPHLLRVTPLSEGVYRCLTSDNEEWIVIDLDMV